jgi:AcrR family transcriptional regulator
MSPRTKKQFEDIRQEKREIILSTALEVFATHGYHGSSISTIAKHAGISKGLLYNYFESKEELLKAVVSEGFKEFMDILNPIQDDSFTDEMLTPDAFRKLFKNIFQIMKSNIHFWRLYYAMALQPGVMEMILNDYESIMFSHLDLLEKYYKKQGSKKPRADALHTFVMLDGITMNYIQPHKEFSIEELEDTIINGLETPLYK